MLRGPEKAVRGAEPEELAALAAESSAPAERAEESSVSSAAAAARPAGAVRFQGYLPAAAAVHPAVQR